MLTCESKAIQAKRFPRREGSPAIFLAASPTIDGGRRAKDGARLRHRSHIADTPGGIPASDDKGVTMRFGHWRGVTLAVALISAFSTARTASADGFHYTIPRE